MKNLIYFILGFLVISCQEDTTITDSASDSGDTTAVADEFHPSWAANASIYEVNIRQHTPEGTINAFADKLPELKDLGVKILWIMPVQPIGVKNRKGGLGSYYSISDYTAVNPEFGSMDDFRNFVSKAHDMGFKVILDWVANHSSWDNVWMEEHPEWYTHRDGKIIAPNDDWTDVADLNYDEPGLRKAMLEAMKFWVTEADVDGFRCDVAFMVPMDFWDNARKELDNIKPVFMLAEAEGPEFHKAAFDMTYGWHFHHIMNMVAQGEMNVSDIVKYLDETDTTYTRNDIRMYFTTNHDENSWNGTIFERMPDDYKGLFAVATTLRDGMPLIYSGQEYGLDKRLSFFDKDTISATDSSLFTFYERMIALKSAHPALQNGDLQGSFELIDNGSNDRLLAYTREKNGAWILVIVNFGDQAADITLPGSVSDRLWRDVVSGESVDLISGSYNVGAHDYLVVKSEQ